MSKFIPLTKGQHAIVDDADFAFLSQWKWMCRSGKGKQYATRTLKQIGMHSVIMDAPDGMVIDHIDGNGLNNQRSNLRICSVTQNAQNRKKSKGGSSIYKGVHWYPVTSTWCASIQANNKKIGLGYFRSEIEAAQAYDCAARHYFGEFANLNFPNLVSTTLSDYQQRRASEKAKSQEMRRRILAGDPPLEIATEFGVLVKSVTTIRSQLLRQKDKHNAQ